MRELHGNIKVTQMIDPIVGNNTAEGTPANGLNKQGFDSMELIALIGLSGDVLSGSVKIDVILEESDDDSTYTAVTNADDVIVYADGVATAPDASGIIATIDASTKDETKVRCGYVGNSQYVRLNLTFTGTHTNGTPIAMLGLQSCASVRPVSDV